MAAASALHGMLDRLHGAPLSEFVGLRKALAAELKERGDKDAAAKLLAVKKPPITAWALNQVALHHPGAIEAFLAATEKLRAAQQRALGGHDASDFRESGRELQRQLGVVIALARKALDGAGHQASTVQVRRIGQSLHSTAFAAPSDLARLAAGHLEADLDVPVDFGVFAPEAGVQRNAEREEEERHAARPPAPKKQPQKRATAKAEAKAKAEAAAKEEAARAKKEEERRAAENRAHQARELREARAEATDLAKKAHAATKRATLLEKAAKIEERKAASARRSAEHANEAARIAEAAAAAAAERVASLASSSA